MILTIMKYHIKLARNDVIGELAGSRSSRSLDDFSEPFTAVIVKKRTGTPSFIRYLSQCSYLAQIIQYFSNVCQRVFKKRDFGALASTFHLFVKKGLSEIGK